jgi:Trypsin-like peptidase domain
LSKLTLVLLLLVAASHSEAYAQTAASLNSVGGTSPVAAKFVVIRTISGTKSVQRDAQFIIADPHTVFHLGNDHKVIVEFDWSGPVGPHKIQGLWKDPTGKVVVVSDFDFNPKSSPFAAYFTMLMDESAAAGIWTLDARIDGETAGSFSFEIVAGTETAPPPSVRIPLSQTDIYHEAQASTVFIEKLDAAGKQIGRSNGFVIGSGQVVTTFDAINAANKLRVIFSSNTAVETTQVAKWDRAQGWAVLSVDTTGIAPLKTAQPRTWNVGDRFVSLGLSSAGGRIIVGGSIVGDTTQGHTGERVTLSIPLITNTTGTPVLNEFGDLIGMLTESLLPGLIARQDANLSALAIPIELVRTDTKGESPTSLNDLAAKGLFILPLQAPEQIGFGALAPKVETKNGPGWPRDIRTRFSTTDSNVIVFVNWHPSTRFKGTATLRLYDIDNIPLGEERSLNVNIHPDSYSSTYWTVPLATLTPGIYRADVYLGNVSVWRQFFSVVP